MSSLKLKIITPNGIFLNSIEVNHVGVQTTAGDLTIYARHTPIVSTLQIGTVKYTNSEGVKYVHVHRGILQVTREEVKLLTPWLYEIDDKGKQIGPKI
ncbi:F0F1 ATP synthase subunit epsilon [Spiroplasma helicoides]|uniref:F0F1 ATP synthase subunit epsilon n=1 Tax=Spiroplasma helicoides TaxID=216938 RepID=A0A1B3SJB3_9MOLU|nr:F0F1 ATP synthase subunit epsilon [Spiroplasma helicoides]AOG60024.1 F0F1 ATP synthase subunit epsilon [Spiroplasma helicoides]